MKSRLKALFLPHVGESFITVFSDLVYQCYRFINLIICVYQLLQFWKLFIDMFVGDVFETLADDVVFGDSEVSFDIADIIL